jgi:cell division protein FtsL
MKLFLKIIIFLLPLVGFSQKKITQEAPISILLDSINHQIIYHTSTSIHRLDISSLKIISSREIKNPKPSDFSTILKRNKLLFLENRGGDIFALNSNDSLVKIDNSNISNFFIGSSIFIKKDTIFKHGGYGYWTQSNFLTYYEDFTKEWQIYPISQKSEIPPDIASHASLIIDDSYYFFGGASISENGSRVVSNLNEEVWCYNFKEKKWNLIGTFLGDHIIPIYTSFTKGSSLFILDDNKQLYEIDLLSNLITKYKIAPILYRFIKEIKPIYYKGLVYFLDDLGNINKISITELTKEVEEITVFYKNQNFLQIVLIVTFFSIVFFIIFNSYKEYDNNKKLKLLENGIRFKNKFIELEELSIAIIRMVEREEAELSKVYDLVKKNHLSKIQNERIKNQFIDQINMKLSVLTGEKEDFLIVSKSSFDKRYKTISINKSIFGKLF